MKARLIFELIDGKSIVTEVTKEQFIIGRSQRCDVVIPHEGLSRQHCQVEIIDGEIFVTDLASANGVLIDEKRIPVNQRVRFFTASSLVCGSAELKEFTIKDEKETALELEEASSRNSLIATSKSSSPVMSRSRSRSRSDFEDQEKIRPGVHPGVRGVLILVVLSTIYFGGKFLLESSTKEDDLDQMLHEAALKNMGKDGQVKTTNF